MTNLVFYILRWVWKVRHPFLRTCVGESGCHFTCWTNNVVGSIFWNFFFFIIVRSRYRLSLVFRLGLVCSNFKFSAGIQLFGLKTTSHGKPDLKSSFSGSYLRHSKVQGEVRVQGCLWFQHPPVFCGYSTFCHKNHLTLQIWPKSFPDFTLNLAES